jgi:hypothetical protein
MSLPFRQLSPTLVFWWSLVNCSPFILPFASCQHAYIVYPIVGVLSGASYSAYSKYDFPPGVEPVLGNAPIFNYIATVVCASYFIVNMIPYFLAQPKGRGGPDLPPGESHFTIGWKSIIQAIR